MAFCLSADSSLIFLNVSSRCFFFIEPILPDKPLINIPAIISVIPTAITLNERIPPITAKITPATIPVTLLFLYSFAFSSFAFSFSLTISNLISLPAREFCLFLAAIHLSWIIPISSSGTPPAKRLFNWFSFFCSSSDSLFFEHWFLSSSSLTASPWYSSRTALSGTPCPYIFWSSSNRLLSFSSTRASLPLNFPASSKISICSIISFFSGIIPLKYSFRCSKIFFLLLHSFNNNWYFSFIAWTSFFALKTFCCSCSFSLLALRFSLFSHNSSLILVCSSIVLSISA